MLSFAKSFIESELSQRPPLASLLLFLSRTSTLLESELQFYWRKQPHFLELFGRNIILNDQMIYILRASLLDHFDQQSARIVKFGGDSYDL